MLNKELNVLSIDNHHKSNIGWNNFDHDGKEGYRFKPYKAWPGLYTHLYFISNEEIKEGDYRIDFYTMGKPANVRKVTKVDGDKIYDGVAYNIRSSVKKVEATTDSLITELPRIPESFESYFAKTAKIIDEVEVELKDNSLNILRVKKWSGGKQTDWLSYKTK